MSIHTLVIKPAYKNKLSCTLVITLAIAHGNLLPTHQIHTASINL